MLSPVLDSRGFACAAGNVMSKPPCIIGAVIMKMTSKSSMTSIKLTTFTSAFRSNRWRRRRLDISDPSLANEERDQGRPEALHLSVEAVDASREDVVPEGRRNGDG